jgi:hypothetical protein
MEPEADDNTDDPDDNTVFWDVWLCSPVKVHRLFGGTFLF